MVANTITEPFLVVLGKYQLIVTPEKVGFSVSCINVPGLISQGDTLDETLKNVLKASPLVEECNAEIAHEQAAKRRHAPTRGSAGKRAPVRRVNSKKATAGKKP